MFSSTPFSVACGILILLLSGAHGGPLPDSPQAREKDPPKVWKITELGAALPNSADSGSVSVLVWEVVEFGGVLTDEERCLVFKRYEKPTKTGHVCTVGVLTRRPKTQKPTWEPVVNRTSVPQVGVHADTILEVAAIEEYKAVPTDDELKSFLKKHKWQEVYTPRELTLPIGGAPPGAVRFVPKVVDGGLCKSTWTTALGREPPDQPFPELAIPSPRPGNGIQRPPR